MTKLIAIVAVAFGLAACSNMPSRSMGNSGNPAETKNSSDANKSNNPAAVSPGGAAK